MSDSNSNAWFSFSMALIGVIVGYGVAMGTDTSLPSSGGQAAAVPSAPAPSAPAPTPSAGDVTPVDATVDHIRGNANAAITLIEYSDFECPFCARHHPVAQQLIDDNDDVNWVYRHFPLSFHPNAQKAAEASECANELGGNDSFWLMADIIFEKGADIGQLASYATEIGLDEGAFTECLDSDKYAQHISDDTASGSAGGVSGTPGNIIINNETGDTRLVSGAQPLAAFQAAVDAVR